MSEPLKTTFYTTNHSLPPFMVFPKYLLKLPLSETSRILYMLLLDRSKLSAQNPQWVDDSGRVFLCFPISELSKAMERSETTVKDCLKNLEQLGLLVRQRQGIGRPNRLYIKLLEGEIDCQKADCQSVKKVTAEQPENLPCEQQFSEPITAENPSGNNNDNNKNNLIKGLNKRVTPLGRYGNVMLTEEELEQLGQEIPELSDYIERLSSYMKRKNRHYDSHADTLRSWYLKDHPKPPQRSYAYNEDESL